MPGDDYYTPTDADQLRLENELLTFEVTLLRGKLEGTAKPSPATTGLAAGQVPVDKDERDRLVQARKDLTWLLRRLEKSPLRLLLRRSSGYRTLVERWLS